MPDADPAELDALRREVQALRARVHSLEAIAPTRHPASKCGLTLEEREALLLDAERIARVGSWAWNLRTHEVFWSPEMFRILGYDPDREVASIEAFIAAIDPEGRGLSHDELPESIAESFANQVECRLLRTDGSVRYVTMTAELLRNQQGKVERVIGTAVDLTEERRAAEELRYANLQLEEAQHIAQIGNWRHDTVTGEAHWSAEFCRILGEPPNVTPSDELFLSRVHPDDVELVGRVRQEALERGYTGTADYRIVRADGSVRHVRIRGAPRFGSTGLVSAVFGTMQDITELTELQRQLAHTNKMEAIGRLAGGIAHDFNNLLTVVLGNLELLTHASHQRPRELEDSLNALASAQELTQRLLALGRKALLERQLVDPNHLARSTVQLLERVMRDGVILRLELELGLAAIRVDPLQVEQALINLIVNARDALVNGGVVRVGTRSTELRGVAGVELYVADNGPGVPAELRQTIFEPFFTTKGPGGGSGLGLATVVGTVEQHGGSVVLDCPEAGGAVFRLIFPAETEERPVSAAPRRFQAPLPSGAKRRVLVVEDEAMVGAVISRTLERHDYLPTWVNNPRDALDAWRADSGLELVICDVMMPEMRGPELVELLRAERANIRVLFVTGYSEELAAGIALGRVLTKPFTTSGLISALHAVQSE